MMEFVRRARTIEKFTIPNLTMNFCPIIFYHTITENLTIMKITFSLVMFGRMSDRRQSLMKTFWIGKILKITNHKPLEPSTKIVVLKMTKPPISRKPISSEIPRATQTLVPRLILMILQGRR